MVQGLGQCLNNRGPSCPCLEPTGVKVQGTESPPAVAIWLKCVSVCFCFVGCSKEWKLQWQMEWKVGLEGHIRIQGEEYLLVALGDSTNGKENKSQY